MINNISVFQNHDIIKVIISNPIQFNIEVFIVFGLLFFIPNKKLNGDEAFLNRQLTNEVKGLAMLIIIIHHLCRHVVSNANDLILFYDLGYVGVGIFLFLSGFGLMSSLISKGDENFFLKKVIRIYIPFVFMNLIWIFSDYYFLNIHQGIFKNIACIIGIIISDRNYWYIPFLILWYIVFHFVMKLKITNKYKIFILLFVSIIIIVNSTSGNGRGNAFSFPFGIIVALYKDRVEILYNNIKLKKTIVFKLFLICGVLMYFFYLVSNISTRFHLGKLLGVIYIISIGIIYCFYRKSIILEKLSLMILLLVSTTIFSLSDTFIYVSLSIYTLFSIVFVLLIVDNIKLHKTSIFFEFLGEISFELYLIHGALMYSYDFVLYRLPIQISFIIYLIGIILISAILNKLFNSINKKLNHVFINN
ncbi:acyltransferase family protein [Clostridium estertheticum]|uniref:acyltransferase family protein n=1 Tax=Clostridium estertheticum TaxID=238834 RepID=UPI001C0CD512|nr:acyltransferase family protein [Clostridium estertheticum]MBU3073207.1 acyltransferase family protein [Clostridium estertheticum]MBU3163552.1 acyltransferase family protein [Clostridium estertheticum]